MVPRAEGEFPEPVVRRRPDFEVFFRQEFRPVLSLVSVLSGSRWAEDMAQEAFLRAYRDWGQVGDMERPEAWVRVVATNLARSAARHRRSEWKARLRMGRPVTLLAAMEPEAEAVWNEVRQLPARQAQVLALHYLEDRSIADIAVLLDIAEATVRVQLHNGRKALAARLGQEDQ